VAKQIAVFVAQEDATYFNDRCKFLGLDRRLGRPGPGDLSKQELLLRMARSYLQYLRFGWPESVPFPATSADTPERVERLLTVRLQGSDNTNFSNAIELAYVANLQQLFRLAIARDRVVLLEQQVVLQELFACAAACDTPYALRDFISNAATGDRQFFRLESKIS